MSRLRITYHDNAAWTEGSATEPRWFASLDLSGYGATDRIDALPITVMSIRGAADPDAAIYATSVAGLRLERGSLALLEKTLDYYLGSIMHYGRLPEYLFQLGEKAWPIYRLEDKLVTRVPGRKTFTAESIGELRVELADYLKDAGLIDYRKEMALVYLARNDFQPYAPICMLRAPGMAEIPVFRDKEEVVHLVAPINGTTIYTDLAGGEGILLLPSIVGNHLKAKGKLDDADAVGVRKLAASTWAIVKKFLRPYERPFVYYDRSDGKRERREIPIYIDDKRRKLVAARTNRAGRVSLHFADDIPQLQHKLGGELVDIGKVSIPTYLTVGSVDEMTHGDYLDVIDRKSPFEVAPLAA